MKPRRPCLKSRCLYHRQHYSEWCAHKSSFELKKSKDNEANILWLVLYQTKSNNNQNIRLFCLFQYHDMVHSNSISSLLSKQMTKCLQLNVSAEKNWFRWLGKISSNLQYEWTYVRFFWRGGGQVWMCTGLVRKGGSIFNGGWGGY